jgi:argininosuccinate synthase
VNRVVLAYAGDHRTTAAIARLRDTHRAEIVTVTVDVGQGGDIQSVRGQAVAAGATRAHVIDAREEFATDYLLRAVRADARGDHGVPLSGVLARALIVAKSVEVAAIEQASAVAHGAGAHRGWFSMLARGLDPGLNVIEAAGAEVRPDFSPIASRERPVSVADAVAHVELAFERGVPVAINGVEMPMLELCSILTALGSAHGIGRDGRGGGNRPLVAAGTLLHRAHAELQRLALGPEADRSWQETAAEYRRTILEHQWFTPRRAALDAYVDRMQEHVTGTIGLELCIDVQMAVDYPKDGRMSEPAAAGAFGPPLAGGVRR